MKKNKQDGRTRLKFSWACLAFLVTLGLAPLTQAAEPVLSDSDLALYKEAFAHVDALKWDKAHELAAKAQNPLPARVIDWLHLTDPKNSFTFKDFTAFMSAHPKWPMMNLLQRRAEESIHPSDNQEKILAWLTGKELISTDGKTAYGRALLAAGRTEEAAKAFRDVWINGNFGSKQEHQFYTLFRKHLTDQDHVDRLDRLLWDSQVQAARRMLKRVDNGQQALAQARILLMTKEGGADKAVKAVPKALQDHPGLIYERLRWRRRKELTEEAIALLEHPSANAVRPELWWVERSIMARKALQMGHISKAYDLASHHGLTSGLRFADAEWLAGWIALRFLQDKDIAYGHFKKLHDTVTSPISKAKGAYWAGLAALETGKKDKAPEWFNTAASSITTFYGQLAAAHQGEKKDWPLPADPLPTAEDIRAFGEQEMAEVIKLLALLGQQQHMRWFAYQLDSVSETPGQRALTAALVASSGRPDLAVMIARKAQLNGVFMVTSGYPTPRLSASEPPELPLTMAIIRQESNFHTEAISPKGARGLMQIMPLTAQKVAKIIKVGYSKDDLTKKPDYNVKLGTIFIQDLLVRYKGSYVLAIAAYNAGTSRVDRWIRENGDPRSKEVSPVDWIEMIPFGETRNYVQRVLEGLQIYRAMLGKTHLSLSLDADLKR